MRWRDNPERVAWMILTTSFVACCTLAVIVPLLARGFILHSTNPLTASVSPTLGTVQLQLRGAAERTAVTGRREAPETSLVVTDNLAQAVITISSDPEGSVVLSTLRLFQNTSLKLVTVRAPRFGWSSDPHTYVFALDSGRIRVATSSVTGREPRLQVVTPYATVNSGEGTLDVTVRDDDVSVTALSGTVYIEAAGSQVSAEEGQRVSVTRGRAPNLPVPAEQNLVRNGRFDQELEPYWKEITDVPSGRPAGQVTREVVGERPVARFARRGEDGVPNMIGLRQMIDRDVQGYDALILQLDLLLLHQSVPGGGIQSSEYPLMIDLFYTDVYGKDLHRFWGFYYYGLPEGSTWVPPHGEKVPLGTWYTYESPDLYELLRDTPPVRIKSITVYARGHDYESMVSEVALVTR